MDLYNILSPCFCGLFLLFIGLCQVFQITEGVPVNRALLKAADHAIKPPSWTYFKWEHDSRRRHTHRHRRKRVNWLREALVYLRAYGYVEGGALSPEEVGEGLRAFQQVAGLQEDGELGRKTMRKMRKPRCGNPDIGNSAHNRVKRFAQVSKWTNKLEEDDVLRLRWYIQKYTKDIPRADVRNVVSRAFKLWSDQVGIPSMRTIRLVFTEGTSVHDSDISIMWAEGDHGDAYPFDGAGNKTNILAHTFYPNYQETGTLNGDIHFDEHEKWVLDNSSSGGVHFPYVLLHEIGHALGLGHSKRQEAVMNPIYKKYSLDTIVLDIDDKCAINWNYVGPTNTCLFVWLMVELLPRARDTNFTAHGMGSVISNSSTAGDVNENELWNQQTLEERINATLERLQGARIPHCSAENNIRLQYEVLLEQKLDFPPESARQYGPVVCNFLDGLSTVVQSTKLKTSQEDDDDEIGYFVQQLTVHQYRHRSRQLRADFDSLPAELEIMKSMNPINSKSQNQPSQLTNNIGSSRSTKRHHQNSNSRRSKAAVARPKPFMRATLSHNSDLDSEFVEPEENEEEDPKTEFEFPKLGADDVSVEITSSRPKSRRAKRHLGVNRLLAFPPSSHKSSTIYTKEYFNDVFFKNLFKVFVQTRR